MTTRRTINSDGVEIVCEVSDTVDDSSRPLAVCVHGFPDSPFTWRHLMPRLEDAGWRVAAPFLRGYSPSSIPVDGCLQTAASSLDIIAVHEQLGGDEQAMIVGHDWGAPITYGAANHAPDRWRRVVGMAVPPGSALGAAFLTNTDQLKKSWYMFFFQHPLADVVVPADDMAFIDMIWDDWSPGYDGAADVAAAKDALRGEGHLAAAIGYYRATLSGVGVRDDLAEIQAAGSAVPSQPTLYLHGRNDGCIGADVVDAAIAEYGDHVGVEMIDDTAHFLHLEAPERVNDLIVEFAS